MVNYSGKNIDIKGRRIVLEYSVQKLIEFDSCLVVWIYDDLIIGNNVICFDYKGKLKWMINDIINAKMPAGNVDIKKEENILIVFSSLAIV